MKVRYIVTGKLQAESGLHIGGGKLNITGTDSPVVKTQAGFPYVPGSSFKGVFRSMSEKLCEGLSLKTCYLETDSGNDVCLTSMDRKNILRDRYNKLREKRKNDEILALLNEHLCTTCKIFGSNFKTSKIFFKDLYLDLDSYSGTTEVRDGVVIHRDSESAVDGLKFDYEVVPAASVFHFEILLEDPDEEELGLFLATLSEFRNGYAFLGGNKSRGLGKSKIIEMEIKKIDFSSPDDLSEYLLKGAGSKRFTLTDDAIKQLTNDSIKKLFA